MIVKYSLVTLGFISDWLLPVDVGELLFEPRKYLSVSLCNSVHWCCEYICSAFTTTIGTVVLWLWPLAHNTTKRLPY